MWLLNFWPLTHVTSLRALVAVAVICGLILSDSVRRSGKNMIILLFSGLLQQH